MKINRERLKSGIFWFMIYFFFVAFLLSCSPQATSESESDTQTIILDTIENEFVEPEVVEHGPISADSFEEDIVDDVKYNFRREMLSAVNDVRRKGCSCGSKYHPPAGDLRWNDVLERSAMAHARDMNNNNYFDHKDLKGREVGERTASFGYRWQIIGENIAEGQIDIPMVMEDWLNSVDHCTLIMHPRFKEMGVARAGNKWVQHFGARR